LKHASIPTNVKVVASIGDGE